MAPVEQRRHKIGRPSRGPGTGDGGRNGIWATKDPQRLLDEARVGGQSLRRAVGALNLTAFGLGAIIGTPFAFLFVNVGVIWLRRTRPDLERPYRAPLVRWCP